MRVGGEGRGTKRGLLATVLQGLAEDVTLRVSGSGDTEQAGESGGDVNLADTGQMRALFDTRPSRVPHRPHPTVSPPIVSPSERRGGKVSYKRGTFPLLASLLSAFQFLLHSAMAV